MKVAPVPMKPGGRFDFKPLDDAIAALNASARNYEQGSGRTLSPEQKKKVAEIMRTIDTMLLDKTGLPDRPWSSREGWE